MLLLDFHNYHDAYGHFPAQANYDNNGKPLLSWRVHILPFIDQQALYSRFKLNEPWDSPHNRKLIRLMPRTYANPNLPASSVTNYLAVIGPDSVFSKTGIRIQRIADGTSNTAMMVEVNADRAVPWTKPVDHEFNEKAPKAGLGALRPGVFLTAFADGSVRGVRISVDPNILRALVTKSGQEVIGEF